uniref:BPTI/Kunitz inhibitor domain-containing protein n=1 Tax=Panagrolaimus sp. JU765 TaxID=591449 RepID=A0AC34RPT1_9BILA
MVGGRPQICKRETPCPRNYYCHIGANELKYCCPAVGGDPCGQPMDCGRGNSQLTRWYWNQNTQQCMSFTYRGQKGTQNNFLSKQDCDRTCYENENPCALGPPQMISPTETRYCSIDNSLVCAPSYWCHFGANDRTTLCCPGKVPPQEVCQQPLQQGTGTSSLSRWYYNSQSQCCLPFFYKGKQGNENNFLTKEACEKQCVFVNPCNAPIAMPPQMCSIQNPTCNGNCWCHIGGSPATTVCCPNEGNPCDLPLNRGTGGESLPRWFYNQQTGTCEPFNYCGLKGNQNNFLTREQCEGQCAPNPCAEGRPFVGVDGRTQTCSASASLNTCPARQCAPNPCAEGRPFVGVDGRTQTCSASASLNTCPASYWCHIGADVSTTVCCPGASQNSCNLPMSTGEGNMQLERYYFDSSTKTCKQFIYNGLKGNQNNFLTMRACQLACQPLDNPCIGQPATTPTGQVLFCSATNKDTCPVNFWCHLGATPETTVCCPGPTNPCSVPLAPGTGNAGLARWYYNPDDRACLPFQYNGKRGNQNNFLSQAECDRTCPVFKNPCIGEVEFDENKNPRICEPMEENPCSNGYFCLAGDPGKIGTSFCCQQVSKDSCDTYLAEGEGRLHLNRWYYNPFTGKCQSFIYRGTKGNENNFLTLQKCEESCQPLSNICFGGQEPLKLGSKIVQCRSNSDCPNQTHFCHIGIGKRANVCCKKQGNICDQQLMIGVGDAKLPRFYYSEVDDKCIAFNYSGLGGNENNFLTKSQCEITCPGFRGFCPHGKPLIQQGKIVSCGIDKACPKSFVCHVTKKDTKSVCCPDPASFCLLPPEPGPCRNYEKRYAYNKNRGICEKF